MKEGVCSFRRMCGGIETRHTYSRVVCVLRSLSFAKSIVAKMIFPVLFFLLCATLAESLFEGESCSLSNGNSGICTLLNDCESVLEDLIAGHTPDTICGYLPRRTEPIICCPRDPSTTTTTARSDLKSRLQGDGRGAIARKKCAEYSQYAWTWKYPPIGNREPLNVTQCAVKSIPLITGGEKADRMEFPHMAAIGYNSADGTIAWNCGGTLISETFVLTAAHCTHSALGKAEWVRVGDLNLARSDDGATPVDRRIAQRIRHPDYKAPAQYHDIALLRLESRVPFNGWIRPACLHTAPSTGTQKSIATGWGRVEWIDNLGSDDLLKVTLSLIDSKTCHKRWNSDPPDVRVPRGIIADGFICASDEGKDTCQGDSGGPLVIFSDKQYYCMYDVIGVTSFGSFCGSNFPGVYTRVYNYVSWIESIVWRRG